MKFIDLSHPLRDGLLTYCGLPLARIRPYLTHGKSTAHYAPGTSFQIDWIEIVGNSGTYIDAPFHRFEGRTDIAGLPLERLADLEGLCVDLPAGERRVWGPELFEGRELAGRAVLVRTGWSQHWGCGPYFENHPCLDAAAAEHLRAAGVALVGIDSQNIDDTNDPHRPVHTTLLGADIPIIEHMTGLAALPREGFRFFAVPVAVEGTGAFPVRAFAMVVE